ncbi:UDP-N-acetylmuramoyl-tripeptide--D-alanyl-D-alanine ligase [Tepidibacter thalassicus]|uniref:UDP-N-acetylmuramoyl-tripeptide--D-alanyl-D-alanine ligase n=1 Tax=Tepidibacter thalassicus DSM 15285 TaxID=1123350 RepID=A0A1M5QEE1_9FIRM|nr:UDP-N-acetylmuramoyl-tripeptide--D-alanyl-D-alanine ligase [Tepidibacter thalassicus]SHH12417.1 UDP-N-acetylmuramoyl-tripeptide--D-alanyl-D-alanine ligase [Tepidibacter thalassicus DSM 15285]
MNSIKIEEILDCTDGKLIKGNREYLVSNICIDSRKALEGGLFIPLIGEKFDGHSFILNAYKKGIKSFLKDENHNIDLNFDDINVIEVKDTTKALGDIAKFYKSKFPINYVGVTGSTGKTTTKDIIHSVLSSKYKTLKNEGNFNNHIGLPLTVFNLNNEYECAVLEMGMSSFGEIEYLANIVEPKIAVISNIGFSHIENLGSREGILKAKLEITSNFKENSILIVNGDDEYLRKLKNKNLNYKLKSFGFEKYNDLYCIRYKMDEKGIYFNCAVYNNEEEFFIPARGKHNIYNAMAAILVGIELNLNIDEIKNGLLNFKSSKMRLDILKNSLLTVINDAYNASPDSMKAALEVLGEYKNNRKISVLGDMLEMGDYAQKGHRMVGKYAKNNSDIILTVGKNSEYIGIQALDEGFDEKNIKHFKSNLEVINYLKKILKANDVVLVKGSRGMMMEEIVEFLNNNNTI